MVILSYIVIGYCWLLVVIILMAIGGYFNISYFKLFFISHYWLF